MRAFGTCIGNVDQQVARELPLDIEVPLLHIGSRVVGCSRPVAPALDINQALIPSEGRNDSSRREWIRERGSRGNSIRLSDQPRRDERVDEQVVGCVVPAHVNRQVEHPVTKPDDGVFVDLVGGPQAWADMLPGWKCTATRMASRVNQVIATSQSGEGGGQGGIKGEQRTCFAGVQSDDAVGTLGPVSLQVEANAKVQRKLPG